MRLFYLFFSRYSVAECVDYQATKKLFWGDLHVHTAHSLDASLQGTLVTHQQSYDFARGQPLRLGSRKEWKQLSRPLDFVAITDHAEFFGETEICNNENLRGYRSATCLLYRNFPDLAFVLLNSKLSQRPKGNPPQIKRLSMCRREGVDCRAVADQVWAMQNQVAERNNQDCQFTVFSAYEWSASPRAENLHRNIIFRNHALPTRAVSYFDAPTPRQLWEELDESCQGECSYISIPHNSNLSADQLFPSYQEENHQILVEEAKLRGSHEPLVEIFQHKGSSECYPTAADEQCSFEYIPFNNLVVDRYRGLLTESPSEKDFVRTALKEGLIYQENGLDNPYQVGFVAGTDTHLGAPGLVSEDEFIGHGGAGDASGQKRVDSPYFNPGGLTGVWAKENTRDAIFSALRSKEVFGSSGPRIALRFFAVPQALQEECGTVEWVEKAYQFGVAMGGTLNAEQEIHFYLLIERDLLSEPLEKAQIIKGWVETQGAQEKVYTLELQEGLDAHCLHWQDPTPSQGTSFYYTRVLEQKRQRWSSAACREENCPDEVPEYIQERAWSSPIWITR